MLRPTTLLLGLFTAVLLAVPIDSASGNFRLEPPAGWIQHKFPGVLEPIHLSPEAHGGFRCNLVLIEEAMHADDTLDKALEGSIRFMKRSWKDFESTGRSELKSASGNRIIRLDYRATTNPGHPRCSNRVYFMIVGKNQLLTATITSMASTPTSEVEAAEKAVLTIEPR